ncbi:unnamed protein product [Orchesella dallaii]|uniref:Torso-like protein n=1 Tax=Orchesella dallaii TaxID=48710 RepID=A0ABP1R0D7_9HEXA
MPCVFVSRLSGSFLWKVLVCAGVVVSYFTSFCGGVPGVDGGGLHHRRSHGTSPQGHVSPASGVGHTRNPHSINSHASTQASAYIGGTGPGVSHPVVPGAVMHLFPRYGYLSLSMRVVPRNDTQNWIFLEPSKEVLDPSTYRVQQQTFLTTDNSLPLHNEFHIDLCEDLQQLVQAYFRRFVIEGLDRPWHSFAGGWRTPSLAKYFGIDPQFVKGDYRYMLVRVLMVRQAGRVDPFQNMTVLPNYRDNVHSFRANDYTSSFKFFNDVGTHYISSFLTGNSIYQVFVYDAHGYEAVKRRLSETGWIRSSYMAQLPYLLPLWVKHMGKVMILNSSPHTTQAVREALTIRFLFSVYPNIFKMHDNAELVRRIEKYLNTEPDGLLGLELKTLDVVFRDLAKKKWYDESLQQTLQLWEINL